LTARAARAGARIVRPITLMVPPMNEAIRDILRATDALPLRVSWYPSTAVMTADCSPGRFIRTAVIEPPNMAP